MMTLQRLDNNFPYISTFWEFSGNFRNHLTVPSNTEHNQLFPDQEVDTILFRNSPDEND